MLNRISKWYICPLIALLVVLLLGVPYTNIGFDSDVLGVLSHLSSIETYRELLCSMSDRMEVHVFPLNFDWEEISIFSLYRPLFRLYLYLSHWVFGLNAYAHFLFNIFLHGLVSSFVYIIFSKFIECIWAFLLALVFAFHPALGQLFLGSFMNYVQCYFVFAISILLYYEFIESDKFYLYLVSAFFYLISLFIYEMPFFMPVILFLYFLFYDFNNLFKKTWFFFVANAIYFLSRILILGFPSSHQTKFSLMVFLRIFSSLKQVAKPFWGLSSSGNVSLVIIGVLFLFVFAVFFIWAKFQKKKLMIFYLLSFLIASWILFIGGSETRYLYMALPFFCLILFELLVFVADFLSETKRSVFVTAVLLGFAGWGVVYTRSRLAKFEKYTHVRDKAFEVLKTKYEDRKIKVVFVGKLVNCENMVFPLGSGMMQAARIYLKNKNMEVYDVLEARYYSKHYPNKTFVIRPIVNGYRLISPEPDSYSIICPDDWREDKVLKFSMGEIKINKKFSNWQAVDVSFTFDEKWRSVDFLRDTVFLTWDMVKEQFIELDKRCLTGMT